MRSTLFPRRTLLRLRDLVRLVEHISLSPTADGKLFLTMNRSTANESVSAEQIKKAVRFPVTVAVPNNYMDLLRSINEGRADLSVSEIALQPGACDVDDAHSWEQGRPPDRCRSCCRTSSEEELCFLEISTKGDHDGYIDVHDTTRRNHARDHRDTRVTGTTMSDSARSALKTAVHNDLIKRTDLQKLSAIQADADRWAAAVADHDLPVRRRAGYSAERDGS